MDLGAISENPVVSGSDGGRAAANVNYVLYIAGFFTLITAVIGVVLAYANRDTASPVYRSHFDWQIKVFWRGIVFGVVNTMLYLVITVIAAATFGIVAILYLLPLGIGLWWMIWTVLAIAKGMQRLGQGLPIAAPAASGFRLGQIGAAPLA